MGELTNLRFILLIDFFIKYHKTEARLCILLLTLILTVTFYTLDNTASA